jgi:5-(carboxyamino)imidazole ribonucleotide synthase
MTRLGIFGGGQLAQMLTQAAIALAIDVIVFERSSDSPAGRYACRELVGDWEDRQLLQQFGADCDCVTLENEFVDASLLTHLETAGTPVFPTAASLAVVQDKLLQKQRLNRAGIAVAPFRSVTTPTEIQHVAAELGWPLLLKTRRNGYDGYGNATLTGPDAVAPEWERLSRTGSPLLVEAFVPFVRELAIIVVRGRTGELRTYPVVETVQQNHICHIVRAPAPIDHAIARKATDLATQAVASVEGVGVFGVEMFQLDTGQVLINELAPRPHNTGHYTIEACVTSQFENHLRAVLGWPLGETAMRCPAAVMVNVLGHTHNQPADDALTKALTIAGAHIHLYGKRTSRPGRKMGHVTALADDRATAEQIARQAVERIVL